MLSDRDAHRLLNRLTFGSTPAARAQLRQVGLGRWLDDQMALSADADLERRLATVRLRLRYRPSEEAPELDDERPLSALTDTPEECWQKADLPKQERRFLRQQLVAATLVRAVHGTRQLHELMCDFWHNHFSVFGSDARIAVLLPPYDRDVIRPNALGNFRTLLEAVAESPAMLTYLDNDNSRAGRPNENFARELLELHTLGEDRYYNHKYKRWQDAPGALRGEAEGYIDEDVYEVARAFTGWSVADGSSIDKNQRLAHTGKFAYVETWHDNYQKRVLGADLPSFQLARADGRQVLQALAAHRGTAEHVCRKLCVRLFSGDPPRALRRRALAAWSKFANAPDQIAQVVRAIAASPELRSSPPTKVKRPLELVAGFARATGLTDFTPTTPLLGELDGSGQQVMAWPTPTGHPDTNDHWLTAEAIRSRWALVMGLAANRWQNGALPVAASPSAEAAGKALARWGKALLGEPPSPHTAQSILEGMGLAAEDVLDGRAGARVLTRMVAYLAMTPEFQVR